MGENVKTYTIPNEFCVSPFYAEGDVMYFNQKDGSMEPPFLFDILLIHHVDISGTFPWKDTKKIDQYFQHWEEHKDILSRYFRERNKEKMKPLMRLFIAYYIDLVFWTHGFPVVNLNGLDSQFAAFTFIPVNLGERLGFVLEKPYHHLSFVQLNELYIELKKKRARAKVQKYN